MSASYRNDAGQGAEFRLPDEQRLLRIGELAARSGKSARALHLYEEMGLLTPARRSAGGFRLYDEGNVERITYIDALQTSGFSLSAVSELLQTWTVKPSPAEAMAWLAGRYRGRLKSVRQQLATLKSIEAELTTSLKFLAGCDGCPHDAAPEDVCGRCMRNERKAESTSPFVMGLTAH